MHIIISEEGWSAGSNLANCCTNVAEIRTEHQKIYFEMELFLQIRVNLKAQVLDEWEAADIYSCFSAAIAFSVVPSPWQAVLVSVFDTHSLRRAAQSRPHWHRSHAKLSLCETTAQWGDGENAHKGAEVERRCWGEIGNYERNERKGWKMGGHIKPGPERKAMWRIRQCCWKGKKHSESRCDVKTGRGKSKGW